MANISRFRPKESPPAIPKGLQGKARAFWQKVVQDFELEPFHVDILERACWSLQRCEEAREVLQKEGSYYHDDKGRILRHPAMVTEEKNQMLFTRFIRELGLDLAAEAARPPTRQARRTR